MVVTKKIRNVWQVGGGPASRPYADLFLKYGVALIGPGDPGPWSGDRYAYDFALKGFVGRFAQEAKDGDVILLRTGLSTMRAIGLVVGGYEYLEQFDDVNGWDLQHARRVRWCELPSEHDFGTPVFGASPMRFTRVQNEEILDYVNRFLSSPPTRWQTAPLPALPPEELPLEEADVPETLRLVVAEAKDLVPIYADQQAWGAYPAEDELIAHLVVPFLRALGWPPERVAVKWRNIDVTVFSALPRVPDNSLFVIEAKRLGAGVEGALEQAKGYVEGLGVLRDVIVTDGVRYRMYSGERGYEHIAYANLIRLKRSAVELFDRMRRP